MPERRLKKDCKLYSNKFKYYKIFHKLFNKKKTFSPGLKRATNTC